MARGLPVYWNASLCNLILQQQPRAMNFTLHEILHKTWPDGGSHFLRHCAAI